MFNSLRIYGIRDKATKEWWISKTGKYFWTRARDAKNAYWYNSGKKKHFMDQNTYEIIEFGVKEIDKELEMTNLNFRKKLGLPV